MNKSKGLETTIQDLPYAFKVRMADNTDEESLKESLISEIVYNSRYYDELAIDPSGLQVEDGAEGDGYKTYIVSVKMPA